MSEPISPNVNDRISAAIRAIVIEETAPYRYAGQYEYTITAIHGQKPDQTIDARAADPSVGLPDLNGLKIQREIGGLTGLPEVGFGCRVIFLNRDPALPRVTGWDHIGNTPIARVGDRCSINFPQQAALLAGAGGPLFHGVFTGTLITLEPNIDGFITVGSKKAFSG